jgi:hypothetical protein
VTIDAPYQPTERLPLVGRSRSAGTCAWRRQKAAVDRTTMPADDMHATTKTGLRHISYAAQRSRYQFGRTFETGPNGRLWPTAAVRGSAARCLQLK